MSKAGKDLWWGLFCALCFVLWNGYSFNCSDQEEHLPQVYKLLNPSLYINDYFVDDALTHFTVRYFYVKTVYWASCLMGVEAAVMLLFITCLVFSFYFIKRIAQHLFSDNAIATVVAFTAPLLFKDFTTGGNSVLGTMLIGSSVAMPLCLASVYSCFKKQFALAGVFAGLACWYQALMGFHVFMVFGLLALFCDRAGEKKHVWKMGVCFFLFSIPMLGPVLLNQFPGSSYDKQVFYEALFFFRNPHHYIPSQFAVTDYLKTLGLLLLSVAALYFTKSPYKKHIITLNVICVCLLLTYYILFEVLEYYSFGKTQLFKITVWMALINGIILTGSLAKIALDQFDIDFIKKRFLALNITGVILLLLFFSVLKNFMPAKIQNRYMIGTRQNDDLFSVHQWIKENTDVKAMLMSFPEDHSLLCEAQRPVYVAYKAIIHEPWYLNNWMEKFKTAYGIHQKFDMHHVFDLENISASAYLNEDNKKNVDYFIARNETLRNGSQGVVYSNKSYSVIHILR